MVVPAMLAGQVEGVDAVAWTDAEGPEDAIATASRASASCWWSPSLPYGHARLLQPTSTSTRHRRRAARPQGAGRARAAARRRPPRRRGRRVARRPGRSPAARESELDLALQAHFLQTGAEPYGPYIVATGAHAALPHHHVGDTPIAADAPLLTDFGCGVDGYFSDTTRVLFPRRPRRRDRRGVRDRARRLRRGRARRRARDAVRGAGPGRPARVRGGGRRRRRAPPHRPRRRPRDPRAAVHHRGQPRAAGDRQRLQHRARLLPARAASGCASRTSSCSRRTARARSTRAPAGSPSQQLPREADGGARERPRLAAHDLRAVGLAAVREPRGGGAGTHERRVVGQPPGAAEHAGARRDLPRRDVAGEPQRRARARRGRARSPTPARRRGSAPPARPSAGRPPTR